MSGPFDPVSTAALFQITSSPYYVAAVCPLTTKNLSLPPEHIFSGLFFTCRALQNAQEDSNAELRVCFKRAYDVVLRHHHSFVIRSVVSVSFPHGFIPAPFRPLGSPQPQVAIHAVPRRDDFFTRIAQGGSIEKLHIELAKWLAALDALVIRLSAFLIEGNFGRV